MGWSYRVIRTVRDGEESFAIHEVYFGDDGKPNGCTINPVTVESDDGIPGLSAVLERILIALTKDVIDMEYFDEQERRMKRVAG